MKPTLIHLEMIGKAPVAFHWHGRRFVIVEVAGTWSQSGHWWDGQGERRFFRVQTRQGAIADLSYQVGTGEWLLHCLYD
jgi:hypothetical protein